MGLSRRSPRPMAAATVAVLVASCAAEPRQLDTAERAAVVAEATVDRAVATVGDRLRFRVVADADPAREVEIADPALEVEGFRVVDAGAETRTERGRRVAERWVLLRADEVGSYILPPVAVRHRLRPLEGGGGGRAVWEELATERIFVEVESVLGEAGDAAELRDIKPIRDLPTGVAWWLWLLAAVALVALAVGLWLWWRRRAAGAPQPRPAHEVALEALAALRDLDLAEPGAVRRFHFALSDVVRVYVEGRFALNATDLTTEEIVASCRDLALAPDDEERLCAVLRDADQVKFARHLPGGGEIEASWERSLRFVESTVPEPRAEDSGTGGTAAEGAA